ncbi:MAG: alpha/beta hydrolase [Pseudomonadota bacterium]
MRVSEHLIEHPYQSIWVELSKTDFHLGWVDAGGIKTRFLEAGNPELPAVIFIHGTAGSLEAFCANIASHSRHFHCYAIDLVGSGYTDKPDVDYEIPVYVEHLRSFMDAMGIDRTSLVGVSLGAWIISRFATLYPERVKTLTLLSAAGLVANAQTMNQIKSIRSGAVENPTWENVRAVLLNLLHRKHKLSDDLIAVRQAIYGQPGMLKAMAHTLCLQDPDIRKRNLLSEEQWRSISVSTLIIGSLQDHDDYLKTAKYVADVIPNASYVAMSEVGHWPQYEDSETFNKINLEFLLSK